LQIYVIGEPAGEIKKYLDWILSPEGQKVVLDLGYVPVKQEKKEITTKDKKHHGDKEDQRHHGDTEDTEKKREKKEPWINTR
jgi:ABC-type Fe3+ transport system substrate-binding protein